MNGNSSMIVTLCSHLCAENCHPLEPMELTRLTDAMTAQNRQLEDIVDFSDKDMMQYFGYGAEEIERIRRLFCRAGSLGFELEKLSSMGIGVLTRADAGYPNSLKTKLKGSCVPLYYYVGELDLLNRRAVGFVGSRTIGDDDVAFTERTVGKINQRGFGVVSGGAKGADSAASGASIANGSFCVEYIADSLIQRIKRKDVISALQSKGLLLMSAANPDAGFSAGLAMQRNRFIYAHSEATVVVKSDYNKGGTWSGATQALKKGYCPVLCRDLKQYKGNAELIKLGAIPIDDAWDGDMDNIRPLASNEGEQLSLFDE